MSENPENILGNYIEIINGYAFKSKDFKDEIQEGFLPVLKIKNVANGDVHLNGVQFHKLSEELFKYLIEYGDILLALTGNHPHAMTQVVGETSRFKLNVKALLNQRVAKIEPRSGLNKDYLYYFLKDNSTHEYIASQSTGSANQANISKKDIENIPFELPKPIEQETIAELLSSLDDKIDLLKYQNKTLEQMAEAIFRHKIVEAATDDWELDKLENIAEVQNGYAFSSKNYVEYEAGHLEVLKMGHIERGGGLRANPKKDYVPRDKNLERWILNKGDIVMAMTDMKDNVVILGVPAMVDKEDNYVLNQRVARIYLKSKKKLLNNYLLYIQLKDSDFIANLQSKANSGVQVNLSTAAIKDSDIIIPPIEVQNEIGNTITDLYLKKENNDIQIQTLSKLRDTLLPKLMNGEIKLDIDE